MDSGLNEKTRVPGDAIKTLKVIAITEGSFCTYLDPSQVRGQVQSPSFALSALLLSPIHFCDPIPVIQFIPIPVIQFLSCIAVPDAFIIGLFAIVSALEQICGLRIKQD